MIETVEIGSLTLLPEARAIIAQLDNSDLLAIPKSTLTIGNNKVVPWGDMNTLPADIMEKVGKSEIVSSNLQFNVTSTYGQGLKPMKKVIKAGKVTYEPCEDKEVLTFWEDNDIDGYFLEQCADMNAFFNVFPEIILNGARNKIFSLRHKEATFSRWGVASTKTGNIEKHFYSGKWGDGANETNTVVSDVLNRINPYLDLTSRISTSKTGANRFIMNINFPTPGRIYYQQPPWWSIFVSGSFDFAAMLWNFKKLLMKNGLAVRYIIYVSPQYWDNIFTEEKIDRANPEAVKARKEIEFTKFRDFLSNPENTGKGLMAIKKMIASGTSAIEEKYITIEEVKTSIKGGEFLDDSSEVTNTMSYAMGIHANLIGSAPGKNGGSLGGTDKRELFMIKTALLKPFRDRLIQPLKLIKRFNGWPEDLEFVVPDFEFTTLDNNKSGKQEVVPAAGNTNDDAGN